MNFQALLSDLGDLLCVSAMAMVVAAWCWRHVSRVAAGAFLAVYATAIVTVTGLKLISADRWPSPRQVSLMEVSSGAPSGHAAMVMFVYGLAAVLFLRSSTKGAKIGLVACVAVIAGVDITRVTLGMHSVTDVLIGAGIGAAFMAIPATIVWSHTERERPTTRGLLPTMTVVAVLMLACGLRLPSSHFI